ncbi:MAG: ABC transporter ATP-binding protein [Neomegalonema sp.]|nr:ABC transporter ATP-binding protein [Neomegalonema sp.]
MPADKAAAPSAETAETVLEIRNLNIAFKGTPSFNPQTRRFDPSVWAKAVDDVSLQVRKGEVLALVGESGSGKSLTALSSVKLTPPGARLSGDVRILGKDVWSAPPYEDDEPPQRNRREEKAEEGRLRQLRGRDVAMIFQEPMSSLNPLHRVERQIGESLSVHQGLSGAAARERVLELLDQVGIRDPEQRLASYPHQLSGGQRQRVMIAMALANNPKLLIADEPTTALDVTIQAQILALLADLQRARGMAMLFITHDLGVVRHLANRVAVMKGGRIVETGPTERVFDSPEHEYTRILLAAEPKGMAKPAYRHAPEVMTSRNLKIWFPIKRGFLRRTVGHVKAVNEASVTVRKGETLGVVGESGSGKTTLGLAMLRLLASEGEITFGEKRIDGLSKSELRPLRSEMQIVFQDPFGALSPRMTVAEIISEGVEIHGLKGEGDAPATRPGRTEMRERIGEIMTEVGLDPAVMDRYPHEFSGGQRQRVAIARSVILRPKLIVLDEPTSALDMTVQTQIIDLLRRLQERYGLAYLFISHDLRVVRAMSHRIIVMRNGDIVEQGMTADVMDRPKTAYTRALMDAAFDLKASSDVGD